ncbi:hypothetical protein MAPG_05114 [Magnaporthiopsis poae ATCC 64411]|uniref:AB hydrolase-1 domain-containing protein n=1 Tax=Magnaporthiopsis poae (strain ATCC 64411 / 73-15) TaxID=644358 RepID=A0A0C4DYJ2_MAGP6|nr:hypothetical protein MAPG_05114 [Magnaporthiopsis poae ATCC 64411]
MGNPNLSPAAASRVPLLGPNHGVGHARTAALGGRGQRSLCVAAVALLVFLNAAYRSIGGVRFEHAVSKRSTAATTASAATGSGGGWSWAALEPSRNLTWQRCYDDAYDCARLDVPMDWLDPSDDSRVVLAVIRLRATNMTDYRGPVFFNPGGPGGSGIWSMLDHGENIQTIVGANHDVVTFDPRGVGASVPRVECWPYGQERTFWGLADVGVSDSHPGVIYDEYARAAAVSSRCESTLAKSGILSHISTASHARDMLEILHQMGQDKLKYWGFSYGTILGGTFAAMYPDKAERLVSDGNVDYNEWYHGVHINFVRDGDKVLNGFYELCSLAGPRKCAFYEPTPAKIETRFRALLERLRENPVVVPARAADESADDGAPEMPQIINYSSLRRTLSSVLYQPLYLFPKFARALAALETGDGLPFLRMNGAGSSLLQSACPSAPEPVEPTVPPSSVAESTADMFAAVLCADGMPWGNKTVRDLVSVAEELRNISFADGAVNSAVKAACVGRTVRPKWRYTGSFEVKTAFPVLFINNMADNATPLVSARNNSQGFEGSVLLVQKSYGHTTLAAPSTCTAGRIRAYFQDGQLPPRGTECEPDQLPFGVPVTPSASAEGTMSVVESREAEDLAHAVLKLSRKASAGLRRRGLLVV